jgi:hypothetical protein
MCSVRGHAYSEKATPPIRCICDQSEGEKVAKFVPEQKLGGPSLPRKAWNLAASLVAFVTDGCKTVDREEYERRLAICDGCVPPDGYRTGNYCAGCGCRLSLKARGRAFKCPEEKWTVNSSLESDS